MDELQLITRQQPGTISLDNYEELKEFLQSRLAVYSQIVYTEDGVKEAKSDKATLNKLKKAIDDKRKEIKKIYMAPYLEVESQAKELIALIDEPLALISEFITGVDNAEKERRRLEVREFYDTTAVSLGMLADKLFESPAFFDKKWEAKSTSAKIWQDAVKEKVQQAAVDISAIQAAGGAHTSALLARYLETMSAEDVNAYKRTLEAAATVTQAETRVEDEDKVVGFKILKVSGTRRQMAQLLEQLALMGVECDELEDGMPGELPELTIPNFDSFVAFDIETSGTYGAANGDVPAEITEIGAVKVVNGVIIERFSELCNPGRKIVPRIARLTGISDEIVENKPPVSEVIRRFTDFVGDLPVVGHNIKSSDLHYIVAAANRAGVAFQSPFFDTYLYAKLFKEQMHWENVKLEYLSDQFGISQSDAHRAWCDAEANVGVYFRLTELRSTVK